MTTPKELGKIFKEAREKRGLSVQEACDQSKIHPNVVKDIESGVFDRLGKPYVRGFLKKYSLFLGIDEKDILTRYETISTKMPGREFALSLEEHGEKDEVLMALKKDKAQAILIASLSAVLVILVLVLVLLVKSKIASVRESRAASASTGPAAGEIAADVTVASKAPIPGALRLTLKARGEVWVQVKGGDDTLFAGILKKNESRTWRTDGAFTVWTGKAEMLDFTVNARKIGVIAGGVVKNITVSTDGVKIGNNWVTRLD